MSESELRSQASVTSAACMTENEMTKSGTIQHRTGIRQVRFLQRVRVMRRGEAMLILAYGRSSMRPCETIYERVVSAWGFLSWWSKVRLLKLQKASKIFFVESSIAWRRD